MSANDDVPSLLLEFPAVSVERWRAKVEPAGGSAPRLETRSLEGPTIAALYSQSERAAGPRPPMRAPGWRIALEYDHAERVELCAALRHDVTRGLEVACVALDARPRAGVDGSHRTADRGTGARLAPDDLGSILDALGPDTALHLDAGLMAPQWVRALIERRTEPSPRDAVCFDPLATAVRTGGLGVPLDEAYRRLGQATREAATRRPSLRTVVLDAVGVHDAGASAEQEIAFAIAAGIEHLGRLGGLGLSAVDVMPHLALRLASDGDLLLGVSKLRAVRRLWARVRAHYGAAAGPPTPLWGRTSWRATTRRDPWVNLLRGSVGGLSAVLGGVDVLAVQPFTEALGVPSADDRRWAINTQHILRGESHLGAVDDPAAGSWTFEALTDALARGAWAQVQAWLARGGLAQALRDGVVQAEIAERAAARARGLATGQTVAIGTSLYPALDEPTLSVSSPSRGRTDAAASPPYRVLPLEPRRPAAPFEALRDRSDAVTPAGGRRPAAMLVALGDVVVARPQLDFARNFLAVIGFTADSPHPAGAPPPADVALAVVCGPGATLAEHGPAEVRRLVAAGVRRVLVAGRPSDALRDAGAHDFVHRGRDVVALGVALHSDLLPSTRKADR